MIRRITVAAVCLSAVAGAPFAAAEPALVNHIVRAEAKGHTRQETKYLRLDRVPHGQTPAYSGGRWAIPASIVMCESGGNYNAVNGSSGARGAYQLMPSTYAAYGGDGSWSPADQDRVAAKVWAGGAGRGQWSC
jgi:hypothetical protein